MRNMEDNMEDNSYSYIYAGLSIKISQTNVRMRIVRVFVKLTDIIHVHNIIIYTFIK